MSEKILQKWVKTKDNTKIAQSMIDAYKKTDGLTKIDIGLAYAAVAMDPNKLYNILDEIYEDELIIQLAELK